MLNKKLIASLLVGAATLISTGLPLPALAKNNNNAALNMMAMQMYMQQQQNAQTQAILAQEQAQANYAAAQAAWAANTVPQTQSLVSYVNPAPVCVQAPAPVYVQQPQVIYTHPIVRHEQQHFARFHHDGHRR